MIPHTTAALARALQDHLGIEYDAAVTLAGQIEATLKADAVELRDVEGA